MYGDAASAQPRFGRRIEAIDLARGAALVAMAIYHFAWDLEFFGYAPPGMTAVGGWKLFARAIASSFLFLVGISLVLAHADRIRWRGFWTRLAMVAGAALAITIATRIATPDSFIFFGILHQIALGSVIGLAFLRLPWAVTALAAILVVGLPFWYRGEAFDTPLLWWTGLSPVPPRSNDFVPLFPFFGSTLAGIATARFAVDRGWPARLANLSMPKATGPLQFAGRHSLVVYLVHQPVLIGCLYLFSLAYPAQQETPQVRFRQACELRCAADRDEEFCNRYCVCVLDGTEAQGLDGALFSGSDDAALSQRLREIAGQCTMRIDAMDPDGDTLPPEGEE